MVIEICLSINNQMLQLQTRFALFTGVARCGRKRKKLGMRALES